MLCCVRAVTACVGYGRAEVLLWALQLQLMLNNIKYFYLKDQVMVILGSLCFSLMLSQKEREKGEKECNERCSNCLKKQISTHSTTYLGHQGSSHGQVVAIVLPFWGLL